MISVLILTRNEEHNLPSCLASVAWCDDIVVLDSLSTDRTAEIARSAGARVFPRAFTDFADQRNWAHEHIGFRHAWVFHLDADEHFTPELRAECEAIAAAEQRAVHDAADHPGLDSPTGRHAVLDGAAADGWLVAPRMFFRGRWIPHCTDYPAFQTRFVRARGFRFVQVGHGQREAPEMRVRRLTANYTHDLSACSEDEWRAKHARYARQEAAEIRANPVSLGEIARRIRRGPRLERRRALKRLWFHLPLRPLLRFCYQYGWRGGFLDGAPGLAYCRLLSQYEGMIARELRRPSP